MGLPQLILLFLIAIELIKTAVKDGETKKNEKYDFGLSALSAFIILILLWWGGFFK